MSAAIQHWSAEARIRKALRTMASMRQQIEDLQSTNEAWRQLVEQLSAGPVNSLADGTDAVRSTLSKLDNYKSRVPALHRALAVADRAGTPISLSNFSLSVPMTRSKTDFLRVVICSSHMVMLPIMA